MNEHEFRDAIRAGMSARPEPPPMSDGPVLDAARRDRRRRRALWAGGGSAAAVVAIAVGVAVLVPSTSGNAPGLNVAAGQTSESVTPTAEATDESSPTSATSTPETKPSFPDGQTDRTASSGPRYDHGVTLLDALAAQVPPGHESPTDLTYGDPSYSGGPLRHHQSQYVDTVEDTEIWEYTATIPVTKGNGVGELTVVTTTPGAGTADGCAVTNPFWGLRGTCEEVRVGDATVAVFTSDREQPFEQWASYGHEDGTVVHVAQSTSYEGSARPALPKLPLTAQQLAELAADARFHLD